MAVITFTKQLSTTELLNAYNNNIVEFSSDDLREPSHAIVNMFGGAYRISPSPEGVFRFNFKEPFITALNKNNFADDSVPVISGISEDTLVDEDTENSFKIFGINYFVWYVGGGYTRAIFTYRTLKSVENIKNYALRIMDYGTREFHLLSPFKDASERKVRLTYWEGYPFDVGYYHHTTKDRVLKIGASTVSVSFPQQVGRFVIDDGKNEIGLHLEIFEGLNNMTISPVAPLAAEDFFLDITKVKNACGTYIKWANMYGKFNYWLFNQKDRSLLSSTNRKPIDNDFDDLDDNQSPELGTGRISKESLVCHSRGVSEDEMYTLSGLFESPKIYLYTAESGTQYAVENFIEVSLMNNTVVTDDYKKKTFNVNCSFKLPPRNTLYL